MLIFAKYKRKCAFISTMANKFGKHVSWFKVQYLPKGYLLLHCIFIFAFVWGERAETILVYALLENLIFFFSFVAPWTQLTYVHIMSCSKPFLSVINSSEIGICVVCLRTSLYSTSSKYKELLIRRIRYNYKTDEQMIDKR